jgi:N-acetyl-gamma-glutamylphosphate reductase
VVNEQVVDLSADFRLADVEVYKKVRLSLIPYMLIRKLSCLGF